MNTPHITVFGIPNCDTVKKARQWLADHGLNYQFHDFKKQGVPVDRLDAWLRSNGWETLVNRKGTTWRKLPEETRENMDEAIALVVMEELPSIIKRPLLDTGTRHVVGFSPDSYRQLFQN